MRAPSAEPSPKAASIRSPSQAWLMTMSRMPAATRASTWRASSERPPTWSSGLGTESVSGRMRSPRPAARIIARGAVSEGVAVTGLLPLDPVDQAREAGERVVAGQRPSQVAQHARHVVEVAVLAVTMRQPREDAQHLELALDAHPFVVAIEIAEVPGNRQPGRPGGLPVAHHPVDLAFLGPVDIRVAEQRNRVVGDRALDRILEVDDARPALLEDHQVAAVVVAMHMDDRLREDIVEQLVERRAQAVLLVVAERDATMAGDVPLGIKRELAREQRAVVGREAARPARRLDLHERRARLPVEPVRFATGVDTQALQIGGVAEILEQHEAPFEIGGEDARHAHAGGREHFRGVDEGGAVLGGRRRVHCDDAALAIAVDAEVAAEAGVVR